MYKSIPGTRDILFPEISLWQKIETTSRNLFSLYNYQEIRTPIIEDTGLFNRSLGESAEIVQKQMFVIKNEKDSYVLRPEGTAAIARAYLEANLDKTKGLVKLYYLGPMFRRERPQKGRLRQFHHIGAEVIGSADPGVDIELISLASHLLTSWGISGYKIVLNSLGCPNDKQEWVNSLRLALKTRISGFCQDCQIRFKQNVLRVLDCKNKTCQEELEKIGPQESHLCPECLAHFSALKEGLDTLKIDYQLDPYLVRGLDYYTHTVFEIKHAKLGAQDAIGAGGRYNQLIKELSGPLIPAMGFAFGMERVLLASSLKPPAQGENNLVYLISLGEEASQEGLKLLDYLRKSGVACDTDYENKSLKGALRKASDLGAKFVLLIGEDELKKNIITFKNMHSGAQKEIKPEELLRELKVA